MLVLNSKKVKVPAVDTRAEARVAKERQLREEGNRLLHEGRVTDSYDRYEQLLKLAPRSPAINEIVQKLSQIRPRDEAGKQQLAVAQQNFDQGLVLYNAKKFAESIPFFETAHHINPNLDDAAKYLILAQQEDERVKSERAAARAARTSTQPRQTQTAAPVVSTTTRPTTATSHPGPPPITAAGTASITTIVNSTVNDGYIVVRAGSDEVARENLWSERRFIHTHIPRQVNVTKEFPAKNADLDIWVVIPSLPSTTARRCMRRISIRA